VTRRGSSTRSSAGRRAAAAALLLLALAAGGCGADPCEPPQALEGAETVRFVDVDGDDAGPGTCEAPWRTVQRAVRAGAPGLGVVVREGTYGRPGEVLDVRRGGAAGRPLIVAGAESGDERPELRGALRVDADHVALRGLTFAGPTGAVSERSADNPDGEDVVVALRGTGVELSGSEVRDGRWHAGVYAEDVRDVRIVANHIHDNGAADRPQQANLDHGIYFHSGTGLVASNLVSDNVAFGIQLFPGARRATVAYNTVTGNGAGGVIVAGRTAGSDIAFNVLANNRGPGLRSFELRGEDNRARGNLVWGNGGASGLTDGLSVTASLEADPGFEDGHRLDEDSPAIDRGRPIAGVETDLHGTPRPQGAAPDLGAYERPQG
jgi:hypothetical protein